MLTRPLAALGEHEVAALSLQLIAEAPETSTIDRQKALIFEAKLLTEMGLPDAAMLAYEDFLRNFPDSSKSSVVREKLAKIRASES